ncbi:MAG: hypothetical protein RL518_2462 [Pseudomonadota bacterium]
MTDTSRRPSNFRPGRSSTTFIGCLIVGVGLILRAAAIGGELWLDEIWSLLKVSPLSSPIEIVTALKHDNNHILNSLWMWLWGPTHTSAVYRAPSLIFSALLLWLLLVRTPAQLEGKVPTLWLALVAGSYPLTLYGTEARGYSLALLCTGMAFFSLCRLTEHPFDRRSIWAFAVAAMIGCVSHAIFILFLAPATAWLVWRLCRQPLLGNSRAILWYGIVPPVLVACGLTLTFYRDMEIGGAPLLPYLEVAASTVSIAFGGQTLSSINPDVTGWSIVLALAVILACVAELIAWVRTGSSLASLVALIMVTPWIAVSIFQPHFILPRYFIIQIFFAYLLVARFLDRLIRQGRFGFLIATLLLGTYIVTNTTHTISLATLGRSHFVEIFAGIVSHERDEQIGIGGDQDFQNSIRLSYARLLAPETARLVYVPLYRSAILPPRYIIRETIESYEDFPADVELRPGVTYRRVKQYRAPPLNGSHVTVYEIVK